MQYLMEKSLFYACFKQITTETVPMPLHLAICFPTWPQSKIIKRQIEYCSNFLFCSATKASKSSICPSQFHCVEFRK